MKKTLIALGATVLGASSAIGQPQVIVEAQAPPTAVVSYADLNLASPAGDDRLVQRIRAAAEGLCLENNKEGLEISLARRHCYNSAMNSGMRQMQTAIAARHSGAALAAASLVIRGH